jgi:predicted permease
MDNIIMLFACLLVGMLLPWTGRMPAQAPAAINAVIIHVSLPAMTLLQVHGAAFNPAMVYAAAMPWLVFATSAVTFMWVGRRLRLPPTTVGALVVLGGLGSTSFIGLPMIESFYGPEHMAVGIIIDQLGTFLVLSTAGIVLICRYAAGSISRRDILLRIATFPPLLAMLAALAMQPVEYPDWAVSVLGRLGGTLAPLALISVGLQLRWSALHGLGGPLALGLGFKLVVAPLLVGLVYVGMLGLNGPNLRVTLFEAAMAPQIAAAVVATEYGLNAKLISLMVGLGTVLSFLTLPLWWQALAMALV